MRTPTASIPAFLALLGLLPSPAAQAQTTPATVTVQVNKPGAPVPKNMYGLFFEDINFAADGGLYPELGEEQVFRNRRPPHWLEGHSGRGRLRKLPRVGRPAHRPHQQPLSAAQRENRRARSRVRERGLSGHGGEGRGRIHVFYLRPQGPRQRERPHRDAGRARPPLRRTRNRGLGCGAGHGPAHGPHRCLAEVFGGAQAHGYRRPAPGSS